jgi:hypothetical protein
VDDNRFLPRFRVAIQDEPWGGLAFYIGENWPDGLHMAEPMKLQFSEKPRQEGLIVAPTLVVYDDVKGALMTALAEALDKQGIKTENDFKLQGKMEAMEAHIKDLQKVLDRFLQD